MEKVSRMDVAIIDVPYKGSGITLLLNSHPCAIKCSRKVDSRVTAPAFV